MIYLILVSGYIIFQIFLNFIEDVMGKSLHYMDDDF
jgi:hypothetical protein